LPDRLLQTRPLLSTGRPGAARGTATPGPAGHSTRPKTASHGGGPASVSHPKGAHPPVAIPAARAARRAPWSAPVEVIRFTSTTPGGQGRGGPGRARSTVPPGGLVAVELLERDAHRPADEADHEPQGDVHRGGVLGLGAQAKPPAGPKRRTGGRP